MRTFGQDSFVRIILFYYMHIAFYNINFIIERRMYRVRDLRQKADMHYQE